MVGLDSNQLNMDCWSAEPEMVQIPVSRILSQAYMLSNLPLYAVLLDIYFPYERFLFVYDFSFYVSMCKHVTAEKREREKERKRASERER